MSITWGDPADAAALPEGPFDVVYDNNGKTLDVCKPAIDAFKARMHACSLRDGLDHCHGRSAASVEPADCFSNAVQWSIVTTAMRPAGCDVAVICRPDVMEVMFRFLHWRLREAPRHFRRKRDVQDFAVTEQPRCLHRTNARQQPRAAGTYKGARGHGLGGRPSVLIRKQVYQPEPALLKDPT